MSNKKPTRFGLIMATSILFALPILWLSASVAEDADPQQKKRQDIKEAALLKGRPDNSEGPILPSIPGAKATLPILPIPPYEPVPMTANIGTTGLVVYDNTNGIALINPRNHTISPVLLNEFDWTIDPETKQPIGGQLGSEGGGRWDVAMTSDGSQALISNFGDSKVFFVDLSSGTPVVTGMAKIDFFAEDIAIDPTNTWALVTDGGFSNRIARIHIPTRTWIPAGMDNSNPPKPISYTLPSVEITDPKSPFYPTRAAQAQAVAISPDGRTVIVADYWSGAIHVLLLDPANGDLSYQQTETLMKYGTDWSAAFFFMYRPVNVAISPDGRTAMAANCVTSSPYYPGEDPDPAAFYEGSNVPMFAIDRPGHVVRQPDVILPWKIQGGQSLVFSPDGRRAYLETYYKDDMPPNPIPNDIFWNYQEIQVLAITGPGRASHIGSVRTPTPRGTSQYYGVDCMAITPDGNFLYVTNPTRSGARPVIDVINLRTLTHVKSIGTPTWYPDPLRNWPDPPLPPDPNNPNDWIEWVIPEGIAFPATPPNKRPMAVIAVDKPELILDLNEAATFDGSGSYDPEKSPLTYAWSLVSVPAGASPTLAPSGQTAVLTPDPNIEGTYQVGLVVNDGTLDSKMATASVVARFAPVLSPAGAPLQRLENDFIFYKEYVNRLAWTANPENKGIIAAVKVYRKAKGADDASYTLLASLAPTATGYDDKGLAADQLFTYRITSVSSRGKESDPVVVGN